MQDILSIFSWNGPSIFLPKEKKSDTEMMTDKYNFKLILKVLTGHVFN